jgi:hypothetical protein
MHPARDNHHTRADTIPDVPRTLRHMDTDAQWAERDTANKVYCTAVEAVHRLRGLADLLYGEAVHSEHHRPAFAFLGAAAKDIALALDRATKAQWAEWEAEANRPANRLPAPAKPAQRRASV